MKRLYIQPNVGGMPIEIEDLEFMQDSYFEGFEAALSAWSEMNNGYLILSGLEVSTTNTSNRYSVTGGFVLWDGEIRKVLPSLYQGSLPIQITTQDTTDTIGLDVFADGVARDTYLIRNAKLYEAALDPTPSYNLTIEDTNRLSYFQAVSAQPFLDIEELVSRDAKGVIYKFTPNDFELNVTAAPNNPPYAVKKNGRVHLYGGVVHSAGLIVGAQLLNLPTGFRAQISQGTGNANLYFSQVCGSDGFCVMNLRAGLNIDIISIPVSPTQNVGLYILDGISYEVDF